MAYFYRLMVFLLLCGCAGAHAFVPKVDRWVVTPWWSGASPVYGSSPEAACADLVAKWNVYAQPPAYLGGPYVLSQVYTDSSNGNKSCYVADKNGTVLFAPRVIPQSGAACPENSTDVAGQCVCNAGTTEVGGQCKSASKCDGLAEWCASAKGTRGGYRTKGEIGDATCYVPPSPPSDWEPFGGDKFPGCNQGCMMMNDGDAIGFWDGDGVKWSQGEGTLTGGSCTQSDQNNGGNHDDPTNAPTGKPDEKCAGFKGEVNGVVTCVPAKGAEGDGKTENKQNSDGTSSKTESKTKCEGGTCTTTSTTTNKDGNGVTTGTSTSVVVVSQGQYCAANPTSNVCAAVSGGKPNGTGTGTGTGKGNGEDDGGSFGGSCSGGWTCEGDAVQCAIAKEQHKRACELFVNETDESRLYKTEAAKDRNRDVTANLPGNEEIDVSGKLSQDDVLGGARCISDLNVTVWGRSVSLPLSDICPALGYMGWVLVAVASLAAFRIVSGSAKES